MLRLLTSCCCLVYVFYAAVWVTYMLLSPLYLYIYFVRNDNMLTVGLHCDVIQLLRLIGRDLGCRESVTVFRYARRISSDEISIFKKKKKEGGLCVCFDRRVLLFILEKVYTFGVK